MLKFTKDTTIEKLDLSTRAYNILKRNGINTVEKMLDVPEDKWEHMRNMGKKTIDEINYILSNVVLIDGTDFEQDSSTDSIEKSSTKDKPISSLKVSVRLLHCLKAIDIITINDLLRFEATSPDWSTVENMGAKTVDEVKQLIIRLKEDNEVESLQKLSEEDIRFLTPIAEYLNVRIQEIAGTYLQVENEHPEAISETLIYCIYENQNIRKLLEDKLENFIKSRRFGVDSETINSRIPLHLSNTTIIEEALIRLENDGIISECDGIYSKVYPHVWDYVNSITNTRTKEIFQKRLTGMTLEEVGKQFNVERERIRQITAKEIKKFPSLEEDKYIEVFEKYLLDKESFCILFDERVETYYYLLIKSDVTNKYKRPLKEILTDEAISLNIKKRAERIIYKDYLILGSSRVPQKRPDLAEYVVKKYCKDKTKFNDFIEAYNSFLYEHDLNDDPKLEIEVRTYENKLALSENVLWNTFKSFRYYNINEQDYNDFVEELDLSQYKDIEFSSLKLFREHSELMQEYDIRDEYELHNLLKKIWPKYGDAEIEFGRMPTLKIGNGSRKEQIESMMFEYAPISRDELAQRYEEEYGDKAETIKGFFHHYIDLYLEGDVYSVKQEELPDNESSRMKEVLKNNFYFLSEIQRLYQREFPDSTRKLLTVYNIKSLGFKVNKTYVFKDEFRGAAEYFRYILTKDDITDTTQYTRGVHSLNDYISVLYKLRSKKEIVEFAPKEYINIRRLKQCGITEDMLDDYCEKVRHFVDPNIFFTVSSIREDGFSHSLDDLDFEEWFYSSVLVEDKGKLSYRRIGGNRLFYSGSLEVTFSAFLEWILEKENQIELDDLIYLLGCRYNIKAKREKIMEVLKDTSLYYDNIMDTIYIDYETYFEEI